MSTKIKVYAVYNFIKFVIAAGILLVVAVEQQQAVENTFLMDGHCYQCAQHAILNPSVLHEFGYCDPLIVSDIVASGDPAFAAGARKGGGSKNILTVQEWSEFSAQTSSVAGFVVITSVVFVTVALMAFMLAYFAYQAGGSGGPYLGMLMYLSFLMIVLLMYCSNSLTLLYESDGCWISALGYNVLFAGQLILIIYLFSTFLQCVVAPGCKSLMFWMTTVSLGAYTVLSLVMAAQTWQASRSLFPLIFTSFLFLSIFEVPLLLFGCDIFTHIFKMQLHPGVLGGPSTADQTQPAAANEEAQGLLADEEGSAAQQHNAPVMSA